jgi:1-deoxy-D-xylulose-5-phosphate reductoisomerase
MKNILLLGATGSIGESVLSVISQNSEEFNLYGISFNRNISLGKKIIENFSPSFVHCRQQRGFSKTISKKVMHFS